MGSLCPMLGAQRQENRVLPGGALRQETRATVEEGLGAQERALLALTGMAQLVRVIPQSKRSPV